MYWNTYSQWSEDSLQIKLEAGRETGYFEYHQYTEFILEKYGLLEVINDPDTTVPVNVAVTFDGGSVSRFLGHVTGGYKLVDKRAKHPKTKEALFGESGHEKMQSHVHCFPIKIALAKDTKELYKVEFNDFFLFSRVYKQEKGFRIKFSVPTRYVINMEDDRSRRHSKSKNVFMLLLHSNNCNTGCCTTKGEMFSNNCKQPECFHHQMICAETMQRWDV